VTAARRPRRMSAQQRRDDLITAALELFGSRPPEEVSVDDVTAHAGISRPLFYRYFSGVRELRVAALRTVTEGLVDGLARQAEGEPADRLRQAVRGFVDVADRYRSGYVALLRSGSVIATSETDAAVDEVRNRAVEVILEAIGVAEPSPKLVLTLRCWTAVVEGTLLSWLQERTMRRDELDGWLVDLLFAMLAVTTAHDPA